MLVWHLPSLWPRGMRQRLLRLAADRQWPAQGPKTTPSDTYFTWADHVARLTETEFKLRYRVTPHAFHKELLPKLWSRLSLV